VSSTLRSIGHKKQWLLAQIPSVTLRPSGSGFATTIDNQIAKQRDFNLASSLKLEHIPQGECRMAKAGAGKASALSPVGLLMQMALTAIAVCFASDISAHGGGLNAEGCHHDRKRGGYHCHRDGGVLSRGDAASTNRLVVPSLIALPRVPRDLGVFANCAAARAAGAAPMRRGEPGYGPHLDRDVMWE
jgi:Excalibur calcium-binding domain